ncbi:MAG: hypothetical protein M3P83_11655, partial [Actinomycetota bacterium]|nr:hypothetical protein [Actinomycetota bacterium]
MTTLRAVAVSLIIAGLVLVASPLWREAQVARSQQQLAERVPAPVRELPGVSAGRAGAAGYD